MIKHEVNSKYSSAIIVYDVFLISNMLPLDTFMSCLFSLLVYSTGKLQALQLIVLVVFGVVD